MLYILTIEKQTPDSCCAPAMHLLNITNNTRAYIPIHKIVNVISIMPTLAFLHTLTGRNTKRKQSASRKLVKCTNK